VATLAVAGYGLSTQLWQLMLASAAFNALETAGTIVWATLKQRHVPADMLGRVSSLDWLISIGLLPLSFALTGPVSVAIGARATLVGAGLLGAVVTFAALLAPGMRAVEGRAEPSLATA
jgi:DHA3 family tetracycline resistance protein-like MFS transporter